MNINQAAPLFPTEEGKGEAEDLSEDGQVPRLR